MSFSRIAIAAAVCFLFRLAPLMGQAQATTDTLPRPQTARWELGIDLLPLIDKNALPKATLFFRRNYAIQNHKCRAWRLRVGLDSEIRDAYAFDGLLTGEYTTYAPYLSIGHEWKQRFKRYSWYWATDVSGQYLYSNQYYLVSGDDFYYDVKVRNFDIAFNGIVGCQAHLFRNLSLGLESAFVVKYSEQHIDFISNDRTTFGGDDTSKFNTSIQPFVALNIIYALQKHKKNVKK